MIRRFLGFPGFSLGFMLVSGPVSSAGLSDAAARIQYGYYTRDHAVLTAAARELEASASRDPQVSYLLAYARFSLSDGTDGADVTGWLTGCVEAAAAAAGALPKDPEPRILLAVCAWRLQELEPAKALIHARRAEGAVAAVRRLDYDNPRLALIEAWRFSGEVSRRTEYRAQLEAAAAAFGEAGPAGALLSWGEAETLTLLAAEYLTDGDRRRARDAVEHALFVAPQYWRAVALSRELSAAAD